MKLLISLLRLYPRDFRTRFEKEMSQTLAEACGGGTSAVLREALGLLGGAANEWLTVYASAFEDRIHWLSGAALALALQCVAYAALIPIGSRASASTGVGLYLFGAAALLTAIGLECGWRLLAARAAAAVRLAATVLMMIILIFPAQGQDDIRKEITERYEATLTALRQVKTEPELRQLVHAMDVTEWQGLLPTGAVITRADAMSSLAGLLAVPPAQRPVVKQYMLYMGETRWSAVAVYWIYREVGTQLVGSLARDTWARTPEGWRRIRHEKIFPDRPLAADGKGLILPVP